jgi:hypothetical protein
MKESSGSLSFTVEERILLHLLDYIYYRSKIEVPKLITQEGISLTIRIHRKHLPRSLKSLIEKNLILEKTTHVIGKKQRMKTYYLTKNGEAKALEIKKCIANLKIYVRDNQGNLKITNIKDVKNQINELNNLAEIISCIDKEGIIDSKITFINQNKKENHIDKLKIYEKALEQAWKDGKMSISELDMLSNLRDTLNISNKEHIQLQEKILENIKNTSSEVLEVYRIALKQAMADNKISNDERAILEKIKKHFNIKDTDI